MLDSEHMEFVMSVPLCVHSRHYRAWTPVDNNANPSGSSVILSGTFLSSLFNLSDNSMCFSYEFVIGDEDSDIRRARDLLGSHS